MQNRLTHIDFMRGISILAMIFIHVAAYYQSSRRAAFFWDFVQFAVPVFVFCSGYLFFQKEFHHTLSHSFAYYKKRLIRLLVPYYIFLAAYLPLVFWHEPGKRTLLYTAKSALLVGGVELNWMVLLFLCLSVAMPILMNFLNERQRIFWIYTLAAFISACVFLLYRPEIYRPIMWFPWTLIVLWSWFIAKWEETPNGKLQLFIVASATYALTRLFLVSQDASLTHFDNKYPPNLYHLAYGAMWIMIFLGIAHYVDHRLKKMHQLIHFFSINSYSLFFVHFWVLYIVHDVMQLPLGVLSSFTIVLGSSTIIQLGLNKFLNRKPVLNDTVNSNV